MRLPRYPRAEPPIPSIDKNPWHYIGSVLDDWFACRPARLSFTLGDDGQLGIDLDQITGSLFEYLRFQLAFAVGRGAGLALCASCGQLYSLQRRPNPNRLSYCHKCGRAAAMRAASARYRQRRKEGEKPAGIPPGNRGRYRLRRPPPPADDRRPHFPPVYP